MHQASGVNRRSVRSLACIALVRVFSFGMSVLECESRTLERRETRDARCETRAMGRGTRDATSTRTLHGQGRSNVHVQFTFILIAARGSRLVTDGLRPGLAQNLIVRCAVRM